MIDSTGDTLRGTIKEGYHHTSVQYGYVYSPLIRLQGHRQILTPYETTITPIIILSRDKISEDTITLNNVREIWIDAAPDTLRYIVLKLDKGGEMFRIWQDGNVKLLVRQYFVNMVSKERIYAQVEPYQTTITAALMQPGISALGVPAGFSGQSSEYYEEDTHLYYNDSLMRKKVDSNPFTVRKKDPEKIAPYLQAFAGCPEFVNEVSGEKYRELYIEKVIQKGNDCINKKN